MLDRLARRFKDRSLLDLFERIVRSFRGPLGRGLPIGSLTSQHFANFYLGWLDRHVKETLRLPGYVRYMDDLAFWSDDRRQLKDLLTAATSYLCDELGLELKPWPYLNRTSHGMEFLGCRLFCHHATLTRQARRRFVRKLRRLETLYDQGNIDAVQLQQQATALTAWTRSEGVSAWKFRRAVLQRAAVSGPRARTG